MSMVQAAAKGLVWAHGSTAATVCDVARQHEEACGKSKETTFAIISMIADTQLRGRDIASFCDNSYTLLAPPKK